MPYGVGISGDPEQRKVGKQTWVKMKSSFRKSNNNRQLIMGNLSRRIEKEFNFIS